jgi:predicted site-specific integrase-resolvase
METAPKSSLLTEYLDRDACAQELCITKRTLSRWQREGLAPPSVLLGKRRLFRKSSVESWLRNRELASGPQRRRRRRPGA